MEENMEDYDCRMEKHIRCRRCYYGPVANDTPFVCLNGIQCALCKKKPEKDKKIIVFSGHRRMVCKKCFDENRSMFLISGDLPKNTHHLKHYEKDKFL